MRRLLVLFGAAITGAGAFAIAACGTLLGTSPDDGVVVRDEAGNPIDGGDGEAHPAFSLSVTAANVLVGAGKISLEVTLNRPAGDTTAFILKLTSPPSLDLTLTGLDVPLAQRTGNLTLTATETAVLRRQTLTFRAIGSLPSGMAVSLDAPVDVRIARYYRNAAATLPFAAAAGQTFELIAWGAGGAPSNTGGITGGMGGYATSTFTFAPNEVYFVSVGAAGASQTGGSSGGGNGGTGVGTGGGGGGYSGVFLGSIVMNNALLVAGGGGGGGGAGGLNAAGGTGGMQAGVDMAGPGGGADKGLGGSVGKGGFGGAGASNGDAFGNGGRGADSPSPGGGGGGGHFGGGGGGAASGGGGGASFAVDGGATLLGTDLPSLNHPLRADAGNAGHEGAVLIIPK